MCKNLFVGLLLLSTVTVAWAQDSDEGTDEDKQTTKRPSWSAGLPERTKPAGINKPAFKSEVDNKIELDMSEFGLKTKPQIDMDLPINTDMPVVPVTSAVDETPKEISDSEPETMEEVSISPPEDITEAQPIVEVPITEESVAEEPVAAEIVTEDVVTEDVVTEEPLVEEVIATQPISELKPIEPTVAEAKSVANDVQVEAARNTTETSNDSSVQLVPEVLTIPVEQSIAAVEPPVSSVPVDLSEAASEKIAYSWNISKRAELKYPVKAAKNNLEGWVDVEVTINPSGEVVSATAVDYSRRGRMFGQPAIQSVKKWLFMPPRDFGIDTNITKVYKIEFDL